MTISGSTLEEREAIDIDGLIKHLEKSDHSKNPSIFWDIELKIFSHALYPLLLEAMTLPFSITDRLPEYIEVMIKS